MPTFLKSSRSAFLCNSGTRLHVATRVPEVLGFEFCLQKQSQRPNVTLAGIGGASGYATCSVRTHPMCVCIRTLPFIGLQSDNPGPAV